MDEVKLPFILLMEKNPVDRVQNITLVVQGLFFFHIEKVVTVVGFLWYIPPPAHLSTKVTIPLPTSQASLHTLDHSLVKRPVFGHPDTHGGRGGWKISRISRLQICPNGKLTAVEPENQLFGKVKSSSKPLPVGGFNSTHPSSNLIMGQFVGGNNWKNLWVVTSQNIMFQSTCLSSGFVCDPPLAHLPAESPTHH